MDPQDDRTSGLAQTAPMPAQGMPMPAIYPPGQVIGQEGTIPLPSVQPSAVPVLGAPATQPTGPALVTAGPVLGADDDVDMLDKQWIAKAQDVIEETKADPFQQNHELSKIRAGFLKARYNKVIKVAEDSPK